MVKKPVLATASQAITVDSVGKLVNEVVITETELQNTNATAQTVELEAVGKDAAGNNVAINADDLTWSIKSVKDAEGNTLTLDSSDNVLNAKGEKLHSDGKFYATTPDGESAVTVKLTGNELVGSKGLTVEVEVQVATANNKTATSVVKFNGEGSKYVSGLAVNDAVFNVPTGTAKTVAAKDLTDGGLKISFTKDQVDATNGTVKDIVLTFTGVDQYGKPMVDGSKKGTVLVTATSDNRAAVTVDGATTAATTLTIKAVNEGVATVYVKAGNDTIAIEVTVSKEVAQAIAAGKAVKAEADAIAAGTVFVSETAIATTNPFLSTYIIKDGVQVPGTGAQIQTALATKLVELQALTAEAATEQGRTLTGITGKTAADIKFNADNIKISADGKRVEILGPVMSEAAFIVAKGGKDLTGKFNVTLYKNGAVANETGSINNADKVAVIEISADGTAKVVKYSTPQ